MKNPRLILADAHLILLEGLQRLLAERFEIAGVVQSGANLLQAARKLRPDVIVSEVQLPVMSGVEVAETLQSEKNPARVMFLAASGEMDAVLRAFRAGGCGYVLKHSASSELISAIEEVFRGKTYVTPRIAAEFAGVVIKSAKDGGSRNGNGSRGAGLATPLTKRQIEVMRLVAQGKTMKEVAFVLGISTRTAEAHKYQMMDHLGVRSVPELIQQGIVMGIVGMPCMQRV